MGRWGGVFDTMEESASSGDQVAVYVGVADDGFFGGTFVWQMTRSEVLTQILFSCAGIVICQICNDKMQCRALQIKSNAKA